MKVNPRLKKYIEKEIMSIYDTVDKAHDRTHIKKTIEYAMKIADELDMDLNYDIIYAGAAMHDIGMSYYDDPKKSREKHHLHSAEMVKENKKLEEFFTDEEITTIADICEQHRASHEGDVKGIYAKIVSDADNASSLEIKEIIRRSHRYHEETGDCLSDQEIYEEVYHHIKDKYGQKGYAWDSLQLDETKKLFKDEIENTTEVLTDERKFMKEYKKLYPNEDIEYTKMYKESIKEHIRNKHTKSVNDYLFN